MQTLLLMWVLADVSVDADILKLPGPILFDTNSDKIKPASDPVLAHVAAYLQGRPRITLLRIEVHSDAMGNSAYNQAMSEKRALSVARALVARGVDCRRLLPVGFGESKPIAPNTTAEGRAQNRRTVLAHATLDGKPIGGQPADGGGKTAGPVCTN